MVRGSQWSPFPNVVDTGLSHFLLLSPKDISHSPGLVFTNTLGRGISQSPGLVFINTLWRGIAQSWAGIHKHIGERYRTVLGWYLYTPCEEVLHSPGLVFTSTLGRGISLSHCPELVFINTLERGIAQFWAGIHIHLVKRYCTVLGWYLQAPWGEVYRTVLSWYS